LLPFSKGVEALGKEPYVEINAGLNNIFKIFRIEYVRRLTYTESKNDNRKNFVFVGIDLRF
jgi:hypothetical protein